MGPHGTLRLTLRITSLLCLSGLARGADDRLVLVADGHAAARIVVGQDVSHTARFAAKELRTYIQKSTGVELPVSDNLIGDDRTEIVVGTGTIATSLGVDAASLTRDAFKIKAVGRRIVILGRDDPHTNLEAILPHGLPYTERATLFGAYDFLERFVGVRWYLPIDLGEVVPQRSALTVPAMDITDAPQKIGRWTHLYYGADDRDDPMPAKQNGRSPGGFHPGFEGRAMQAFMTRRRLHALRMRTQTTRTTGNHTMWRLISPARFGKTHPEYFALFRDRKRGANFEDPAHSHHCFTHPGATRELIRVGRAAFRGMEAKEVGLNSWTGLVRGVARGKAFHIMQDDAYRGCLCDTCATFRKTSGLTGKAAEAELVWSMIIRVAEAVEQEFPHGLISVSAYGPMKNPPRQKLPGNILISGLATTGPYEEFMPGPRAEAEARVKTWCNVIGPDRIAGFYHYALKGGWENGFYKSNPAICGSIPRAYASAYRRYAEAGQGTYLYLMSHRFAYDHLSAYVFYKYHWNADRDIDALLSEYYTLFYGPAAKPMERFWEDVEARFRRVFSRVVQTSRGPQSNMVPEEIVWGEIYSPEVMLEWKALFAEAERLAVGTDPVYGKRVAYMKRNVLDTVVVGVDPYKELVGVLRKEQAGEIKAVPLEIKNASFEAPISGDRKEIGDTWIAYYNDGMTATSFRDRTTATHGDYSGCVKGSGRIVGFMRTFPLVGGGVYRFRFQYKMSQARGSAKFRINKSWRTKDGELEAWLVERILPHAEEWTEYQAPILVTGRIQYGKPSYPLLTLVAIGQDENEAVWFDDFRIEKILSPFRGLEQSVNRGGTDCRVYRLPR